MVYSSYITGMSEPLIISDSAAKRIAHLLSSEPEGTALRVAVDGGGCSGFQYRFEFDEGVLSAGVKDDERLFESGGAKIISDDISLEFIGGSVVDYEESLAGAAFVIKNPNAASSCGCGNSFAV